ncbi:hypothetical protein AGMMS50276_30870 [Synergistales bacterium]|nr:hypothetical protein AGMMS50276_30870 [Synergistales bacterium]
MDTSLEFQENPLTIKTDRIEVVLAVYDPKGDYSRWAGIVMTSIFQNTKSHVNVTILNDDTLTDDNRSRFIGTAKRFGQSVSFVDVSGHILRIFSDPDKYAGHLSRGALFRLLIPDLLNIPKVIYLDCDIVVNMDIARLWSIPIENHSLAAIDHRDSNIFPCTTYEKIKGWAMRYNPEKYFNSGVLLMNLSRIRQEHDLARETFRFYERYSYLCNDADQAFLNSLFSRDVLYIDERFNRLSADDSDIDNAILHYAYNKPWQDTQISLRNALFWRVFAESEWGDSPIPDVPVSRSSVNYHWWHLLRLSLPRLPMRLRVKYITLYILHILGYIPPFLKEICLRAAECINGLLPKRKK